MGDKTYKLDIACLGELPLYERAHLRVLLPSKESWPGSKSKAKISATRFSKGAFSSLVVE